MKKNYRIGVYRNAGSGWHGGQIYFNNLIALLNESAGEPVELVVIEKERSDSPGESGTGGTPTVFLSDYLKEERERARKSRKEAKRRGRRRKWWSRFFPKSKRNAPSEPASLPKTRSTELGAFASIASEHKLDFVFPLPATASGSEIKGAGWIPDLQHCFLPELFTATEIETRNVMFRKLSEAGLIVFSSEASRREFRERYPDAAAKLEVWSFCSIPESELFAKDPSIVVSEYQLPERFFVVANQFWKHKDHAVVVEALALLKAEGISIPVVFTGALRDYRGTGHVDHFLQSVQRGGIHESVFLLGFLEREEQLHLMRSALAVIQPSRFEGWSTVVEDCKAIGQRLILSDLAVHQEQEPPESLFFPVGEPARLAEKIKEILADGPGEWLRNRDTRESRARSDMELVRAAARRRFLEIVELSRAPGTQSIHESNS